MLHNLSVPLIAVFPNDISDEQLKMFDRFKVRNQKNFELASRLAEMPDIYAASEEDIEKILERARSKK